MDETKALLNRIIDLNNRNIAKIILSIDRRGKR